ncbi:HYR domain-containing protein, partial [Flavobacterium sp. XS1P27]|uniref:HYR domain-containing protein n=1 Tax=Flavobacterium sp. XS1P27 TaxID=3401724 RepID=UPI003AAAFAF4
MKTFLLKSRFLTFIFLVSSLLFTSVAFGQATVSTDLLDYPPGATAIITGSGFLAGEDVELHVHHSDGDPLGTDPQHHLPWFVTADANGDFTTSWYVPTVEEGDALGATFNLEAHGNMGSEAEWTFTDGNTVTFNSPTQNGTINTGVGGSVTYNITATRDGAKNPFSTTLSASVLSGVTYSFSPNPLNFPNTADVTLISVLTLTVASSVPAGTYTFTVTGSDGNSRNLNLIVSGCTSPTITSTNLGPVNNAAGLCGASVALGSNITITGTPTPTVTYSLTNFGATISNPYVFPVGTTTVWAKSSNSCGDAITSFTVTVIDNQVPTISCVGNQTKSTNTGVCTYTVAGTEFNPIAFADNCTGSTIKNNYNNTASLSGAVFPIGTTNVIWTVTDAATIANTTTCSFDVTVVDATAPVAKAKNVIVQLDNLGAGSVTAAQVDNGSNDACGIQSLSVSPNTFTCANVGANTVTLTVTDNNGNVST